MSELAVCAIVRDEAAYLAEWIAFHQAVGVEKFILYDHESKDPTREVLDAHIASGVVEYHEVSGVAPQLGVYEEAIREARGRHKWLALIDADEFLWSPEEPWLPDLLAGMREDGFAAVRARWMVFGTNGHSKAPNGLVIESYTRRERGPNPHVKSVVNPIRTLHAHDPHMFSHTGPVALLEPGTLRVNHYWTKSAQEAQAKFARGRADTGEQRDWIEFASTERQLNMVEDYTLANLYGDAVRQRLLEAARA